jgi:hypothetical protein
MSFLDDTGLGSSSFGDISFEGSGFPYAGSADANKLEGGVSSSIGKDLAGAGIAGGLLGYNLLKGNPSDPNLDALKGQAGALGATGSSLLTEGRGLQSYLTQGTLPPALQAKVEQDTQANRARIIQNAGTSGSSTDPKQNSALTQDLAAADRSGTIAAADYEMKLAQTGQQLITSGLQATGLSSQLYESLYKYDQQQNSDLMSSITKFASAIAPIAAAAL